MSFTSDATSGKGIPQNSTEWGDAALSPYWAVPKNLWLIDGVVSGNISDAIGTITLTKVGSTGITYQVTVTGWSTRGIHIELSGGGGCGFITSSSTIDPTAKSQMWLAYIRTTGAPSSGSVNVLSMGGAAGGGSSNLDLSLTSGSKLAVRCPAASTETDGTQNPTNVVIAVVLQYDITNNKFRAFTTQERIDATFEPPSTFTGGAGSKGIGTIQSNARSGPFDILYAARWEGADAEIGDWQIREGLNALGWSATSSFSVTYTANPSESASLSESVAEVVSNIAGVSTSLAETEAVSSQLDPVVSISDTDVTTDLLGVIYTAPVAVAETENSASAMASIVFAAVDQSSEIDVVDEALVVAVAAPNALAESESISESTAVGQIFHNALSAATVSVAEALVVGTGLPIIRAISPIPGVAPGTPGAFSGSYETAVNTEIVIQIFDDGEDLATESVVDGDAMMVFQNGAFFGRYVARSYIVFLSNGIELHILPSDNWQGTSVQLTCSATDTDGHLTSLMFTWQLPAVTAVQLPPRLLPPVVPAGQVDHVANALRRITDQFRSKL